MHKYIVTVDLPDRYWSAQLYVEAATDTEAEALVETNLELLKSYVAEADLQVSDVESID